MPSGLRYMYQVATRGIACSIPTGDKFSFWIARFFPVPHSSTKFIQMKSSMTFIKILVIGARDRYNFLTWLDSFPLLSQRRRTRHYFTINPNWPVSQATLSNSTGFNWFFFFEKRRSENRFCCLFSGSLGWSWVIIRIEIKMKSCVSSTDQIYPVDDTRQITRQ